MYNTTFYSIVPFPHLLITEKRDNSIVLFSRLLRCTGGLLRNTYGSFNELTLYHLFSCCLHTVYIQHVIILFLAKLGHHVLGTLLCSKGFIMVTKPQPTKSYCTHGVKTSLFRFAKSRSENLIIKKPACIPFGPKTTFKWGPGLNSQSV